MKIIFKKLSACILALTMVLVLSVSAFAADPSLDSSISVTGLNPGDSVAFYQVLKYDPAAKGGWSLTDDFAGLTVANFTDGTITADDAQAIVAKAFAATATATVTVPATATAGAGVAEYTIADSNAAGLYVAFATPASTDSVTLYNPVFVSADFDANDGNNTLDISKATGTYNNGEAKKQAPTVNKEIVNGDKDRSVAVGDVVPFKVTTKIPAYATYDAPVFNVSDAVSTGLEIDTSTITLSAPTGLTKDKDYTVTATTDGFVIAFSTAYLKTLTQSADVEITYSAKVTHAAPANVNEMTNTASIQYSNNPTDTKGNGSHEVETYHYTFTIDGNINGTETLGDEEQIINKEVVKTAVDEKGNPIMKTVNTYTTQGETSTTTTEAVPLADCTFKLTGDNLPNGTKELTTTTDKNGLIVFKGLDEGTYTLEEVSAPTGYVKDTAQHTVAISATYNSDGTLASYTITIDGVKNTFTAANTKTGEVQTTWKSGETVVLSSLIKNVQAKALPSTGGVGTTIFYISGAILLIGASVMLITKRRVNG